MVLALQMYDSREYIEWISCSSSDADAGTLYAPAQSFPRMPTFKIILKYVTRERVYLYLTYENHRFQKYIPVQEIPLFQRSCHKRVASICCWNLSARATRNHSVLTIPEEPLVGCLEPFIITSMAQNSLFLYCTYLILAL